MTLTIFGVISACLMLVFYELERETHHYVLAFAGTCVLMAIYAALQADVPFVIIETVFALSAAKRWRAAYFAILEDEDDERPS